MKIYRENNCEIIKKDNGAWFSHVFISYRWKIVISALCLMVITGLVYLNSFSGKFVFDDEFTILLNPHIKMLWPLWAPISFLPLGPIMNITLAINYALSGFDVWSYHAINLSIHILAGLILFGIVRRTLNGKYLGTRYGKAALGLAMAIALIWLVHPLQTESVTYIIQRCESLMGLFYLLTLYFVIRGTNSSYKRWWYIAAVCVCALGMATKEVMVTAPLLVLLYDRIFLSQSFSQIFRQRWGLYAGLALTWAILWVILANKPYEQSAGFAYKGISPPTYATTQFEVITHYLKLSIWPYPLCLDYKWPVAQTIGKVLPSAIFIIGLFAVTLWLLRYRPALSFAGLWFFLILAPTSSIIPLADPAFEHRMYLPLAGVVVVLVIAGYEVLYCLFTKKKAVRKIIGLGLMVLTVAVLGTLTVRRNQDYFSPAKMWRDVIGKRPHNDRAYACLGIALSAQGKIGEAIKYYTKALQFKPNNADTHFNFGLALFRQGKVSLAIEHYTKALLLKPDDAEGHNNLGLALDAQGKYDDAISQYKKALQLNPNLEEARSNLINALANQGMIDEAISYYSELLKSNPENEKIHYNLGVALGKIGRLKEGIEHYTEAIRLKPDYVDAHINLSNALYEEGKIKEALHHLNQALSIKPDYAKAHYIMGRLLSRQGEDEKAIEHLETALKLQPDFKPTRQELYSLRQRLDLNKSIE